jgi:hypothetical protein
MDQAAQVFEELDEKEPPEEARFYQVAGNAYNRLGNLKVLADVYYNYSQLLKRQDSSAKALEYLDKAFRLRSR